MVVCWTETLAMDSSKGELVEDLTPYLCKMMQFQMQSRCEFWWSAITTSPDT